MKSIIEQASSIMKAIEKAWNQAEQPKEFSIKIFEKEERNFFGMSVKPAKVGIFFGDKPVTHEKSGFKPRQEIRECRPEVRDNKPKTTTEHNKPAKDHGKPATHKPHATMPQAKPAAKPTPRAAQVTKEELTPSEKSHRTPTAWNSNMIETTHQWIKKTLSLANMPVVNFNSEVMGKNLKLTFTAPLATDPMHEKQLFRSFAHLIMSSLRNQYKQEIKDLKIILTRPE